ncbi:hypothetical protein BDV28DRAFT_126563 [Aspergillus coremiiformis]|uniref:NACHT domain-containing protein n=1 Tax=Aspergillus coremiiformis TaxID=138285 RepID=A0A5N6ZKV9_9EURO|nr:hypothetical protein BDV28DRAFT_126563 [Aspergillus coremiiformis]
MPKCSWPPKFRCRRSKAKTAKDVPSLTAATPELSLPPDQTPRPAASVKSHAIDSKSLWDQAYDKLKDENPDLIQSYETILSRELAANERNVIKAEQNDRQSQMSALLETGLTKVAKLSKAEKGIGDAIGVIMSVKDVVSVGVSAILPAAIAWASLCVALDFCVNAVTEMESNRKGIVTVICQMKWYSSYSRILQDNTSQANPDFQDLRKILEQNILSLYRVILTYIIKSICMYQHRMKGYAKSLLGIDDWTGSLEEVKEAEAAVKETANSFVNLDVYAKLQGLLDFHLHEKDNKILRACYVANMFDEIESLQYQKDRLLPELYSWVLDTQEYQDFVDWSKSNNDLLWIRGGPGMGKTMLLMGITSELTEQAKAQFNCHLSYFFCRGTDDRINTATAIVRGLIWMLLRQNKRLMQHLDAEFASVGPALFDKSNFGSLARILQAMLQDNSLGRVYLVVDALDECQTAEPGLSRLLQLVLETSKNKQVKWLLSSRNESKICQVLEPNAHLCLDLDGGLVTQAVGLFIQGKMAKLEDRYKQVLHNRPSTNLELKDILKEVEAALKAKAQGTFLWVALVIRQLLESSPSDALKLVKQFPEDLSGMYTTLMETLKTCREAEKCKRVLLATVHAFRPLHFLELAAVAGLSNLDAVDEIVRYCGVLVLQNDLVYFIHQSAQDYLTTEPTPEVLNDIFPASHADGHRMIVSHSLESLQVLQRDMYQLKLHGYPIENVKVPDPDPLQALRYSCLYWVDHLDQMVTGHDQIGLGDGGAVDRFWRERLLYWLEALSLFKSYSVAVFATAKLIEILSRASPGTEILRLVKDAYRFVLFNRPAVEPFPLQVYVSALVFSPTESLTRKHFENEAPPWITAASIRDRGWNACLLTLPHEWSSPSLSISPNGTFLAVSSYYLPLKIWDYRIGQCIRKLDDIDGSTHIAFSPDGALLATVFKKTIQIWNFSTWECVHTLHGHEYQVASLSFSFNGLLASSSWGDEIKIWELEGGTCLRTIQGPRDDTRYSTVSISQDGELVAYANWSKTGIWNVQSGTCNLEELEESHWIHSISFTADRKLAIVDDDSIRVWDPADGRRLQIIRHENLGATAWSDGRVACFDGKCIRIWDLESGDCLQTIHGNMHDMESLAFTPTNDQIISAHRVNVKIWDATGLYSEVTEKNHYDEVSTLSNVHGGIIASGHRDGRIRIWDATGAYSQPLETISYRRFIATRSIHVSPKGTNAASTHADSPYGPANVISWDGRIRETVWSNMNAHTIMEVTIKAQGPWIRQFELGDLDLNDAYFALWRKHYDMPLAPYPGGSSSERQLLNPSCPHHYEFCNDEPHGWITWKGHNVLWVPSQYRPIYYNRNTLWATTPEGIFIATNSHTGVVNFSSDKFPM